MDQDARVNAIPPLVVVLLAAVFVHTCFDAPQLPLGDGHKLAATTTRTPIIQMDWTSAQDIDSMTLRVLIQTLTISEQIICKDMYIQGVPNHDIYHTSHGTWPKKSEITFPRHVVWRVKPGNFHRRVAGTVRSHLRCS